ncbi:MAG: cytochrome c biogenesis protein CcsA [Alphaproteobacteria bacterium]|nr:cytochrome c biogenesis protein CcsA [Alphaproteobacteria bacterium]
MQTTALWNLAALAALLPAALLPWRRSGGRDGAFWLVLALAVVGSGGWAAAQLSDSWHSSLGVALWVSVAISAALFAILSAVVPFAWRLAPLLLPYLAALGVLAAILKGAELRPLGAGAPAAWLQLHILMSVLTYALATIGAVAALAAFLQERALKAKRPTPLTRLLPSVADAESLTVRLLAASEAVLGLGLATGMATQWFEIGRALAMDHKTLLSLLAFAVIGGLLLAHRLTGVRGRRAARLVLLAWLLLTLAYPGVKFVTQVLLV